MFLGVHKCFDFIVVNDKDTTSHKCVIQNDRSIFSDISEIAGTSVLIPGQNSFNDCF